MAKRNFDRSVVFLYVPNSLKSKIEEHASHERKTQAKLIREMLTKILIEKDAERLKRQEEMKKTDEVSKLRRENLMLKWKLQKYEPNAA